MLARLLIVSACRFVGLRANLQSRRIVAALQACRLSGVYAIAAERDDLLICQGTTGSVSFSGSVGEASSTIFRLQSRALALVAAARPHSPNTRTGPATD